MLRIETGAKFSVTRAQQRTEQKGVAYVLNRADLEPLSTRVLCDLYNAFSGDRLKKFKSRDEALGRTWEAIRGELKTSTKAEADHSADRLKLQQEIEALRSTLREKVEALRALGGGRAEESPVVQKVLSLLKRKQGATKLQLIEGTEAKKGYIDALLSRILPEKGYTIEREAQADGPGKVYRLG